MDRHNEPSTRTFPGDLDLGRTVTTVKRRSVSYFIRRVSAVPKRVQIPQKLLMGAQSAIMPTLVHRTLPSTNLEVIRIVHKCSSAVVQTSVSYVEAGHFNGGRNVLTKIEGKCRFK